MFLNTNKVGGAQMDIQISGSTKILGLVGDPVEHSVSPQLHNAISKMLGNNLVYLPFRVKNEHLKEAILGLKAINIVGFNVTAPYKKEIMKYIDDNVRVSFLMGAINTVKNIDGRLYGYNTDAEGFVRAAKVKNNMDFGGKKVTILGAGGASRAIAVKLANLKVSELNIINRSVENATNIQNTINDNIGNIAKAFTYDDKNFDEILHQSDVIINATSVGLSPNVNQSLIKDERVFKKNHYVYDIIYSPSETMFLAQAKKRGAKTENGLLMLFYQGIASYEIWTGHKFSDDEIKKIYQIFKRLVSYR